jgi:hypothetical protein
MSYPELTRILRMMESICSYAYQVGTRNRWTFHIHFSVTEKILKMLSFSSASWGW